MISTSTTTLLTSTRYVRQKLFDIFSIDFSSIVQQQQRPQGGDHMIAEIYFNVDLAQAQAQARPPAQQGTFCISWSWVVQQMGLPFI